MMKLSINTVNELLYISNRYNFYLQEEYIRQRNVLRVCNYYKKDIRREFNDLLDDLLKEKCILCKRFIYIFSFIINWRNPTFDFDTSMSKSIVRCHRARIIILNLEKFSKQFPESGNIINDCLYSYCNDFYNLYNDSIEMISESFETNRIKSSFNCQLPSLEDVLADFNF